MATNNPLGGGVSNFAHVSNSWGIGGKRDSVFTGSTSSLSWRPVLGIKGHLSKEPPLYGPPMDSSLQEELSHDWRYLIPPPHVLKLLEEKNNMRGDSDELPRSPFHFHGGQTTGSPHLGQGLCKMSEVGDPRSIINYSENLKVGCVCDARHEIKLPYAICVPETRLFPRNKEE